MQYWTRRRSIGPCNDLDSHHRTVRCRKPAAGANSSEWKQSIMTSEEMVVSSTERDLRESSLGRE